MLGLFMFSRFTESHPVFAGTAYQALEEVMPRIIQKSCFI